MKFYDTETRVFAIVLVNQHEMDIINEWVAQQGDVFDVIPFDYLTDLEEHAQEFIPDFTVPMSVDQSVPDNDPQWADYYDGIIFRLE